MSVDKFGRSLHQLRLFEVNEDKDGDYIDFENKRLHGINDPVSDSEAVNMKYLVKYIADLVDKKGIITKTKLEDYIKQMDLVTKPHLDKEFVTKNYLLKTYDSARIKTTNTYVQNIFKVIRNRLNLLRPNIPLTVEVLKEVLSTT